MRAALFLLALGASAVIAKPLSKNEIIDKIVHSSMKYGVDPLLALAIVEKESNFNPYAKKEEGELGTASIGLFQVLLSTAKAEFGFPGGEKELFDPKNNIKVGLQYIKRCLGYVGENISSIACCYQAGFYSNQNWCRTNKKIQRYAEDVSRKREAWRLQFLDTE